MFISTKLNSEQSFSYSFIHSLNLFFYGLDACFLLGYHLCEFYKFWKAFFLFCMIFKPGIFNLDLVIFTEQIF